MTPNTFYYIVISLCGAYLLTVLIVAIVLVLSSRKIERTAKTRYEKPVAMDFTGEKLPGGDDQKLDNQERI